MTTDLQEDSHLTTGGEDPFLPKLLHAINHSTHIDMAVAFIRAAGLNLIYPALKDALQRQLPARLRIITGDYLEVTEPQALRQLMLLQELNEEAGAQVKVFESANNSFHMKAYIFLKYSEEYDESGCAFVGSSNISKIALTDGLEWNLRVDSKENPKRFAEICDKFKYLFNDQKAKILTHEWIDNYQLRFNRSQLVQKPEPIDPEYEYE
jgi:HKD family nuclease